MTDEVSAGFADAADGSAEKDRAVCLQSPIGNRFGDEKQERNKKL